jgi:phosphatidylglycerol---prolipoprotein diacylglyceryl transferase
MTDASTTSHWVHHLSPVALHLGPLSIHWYGLMYMIGFLLFYFLGVKRIQHIDYSQRGWNTGWIEEFLNYGILGVILGGRLGYVLFYKPAHFLAHPREIIEVWNGGMSFHGGLIGVMLALLFFTRKTKRSFLEVADFVTPLVPTGLAAGRLGNFINGELWGEPSQVPWAVIFPLADALPRHPSQLYEFLGEGVILFILLWWAGQQNWARYRQGRIAALFLIGYGFARIVVECFREPDRFLSTLPGGLSMGQWLSVPMILIGLLIWYFAPRVKNTSEQSNGSPSPRSGICPAQEKA